MKGLILSILALLGGFSMYSGEPHRLVTIPLHNVMEVYDSVLARELTFNIYRDGFDAVMWRGDCSLFVGWETPTFPVTDRHYVEQSDDGTRVTTGAGPYRHVMYKRQDGNFEWEMHLDQPLPERSNRVIFPLHSRNLEWAYQPPLTDEQKARGRIRPDSVVGSYAVYHSSRANNKICRDGRIEKYETGKATHVYRPKAWDSNGDTIWCDLSIGDSWLGISLPNGWLDAAAYPVTIDPTFGYGSCGAAQEVVPTTTDTAMASLFNKHTTTTTDTVKSLHMWGRKISGVARVYLSEYDVVSGDPDTKQFDGKVINYSSSNDPPAAAGSVAYTYAMTASTTYTMGWGYGTSTTNVYYDTYFDVGTSYHNATGDLPADWTEARTRDDRFSAYITYAEGPAAGSANYRRRRILGGGR